MSTTGRLVVRSATPGDTARLQDVRAAAFAEVFAGLSHALGPVLAPSILASAWAGQDALFAGMLEGTDGWALHVADLDGLAVGFAGARVEAATGLGEIGLIAVAPEHRCGGIGTALIQTACTGLQERGARVVEIATGGDPAHAPARELYGRAGFA